VIDLNIDVSEIADTPSSRSSSVKIVVLGVVVSLLLHFLLLVWFAGAYSTFRSATKDSDSVTYEITLNTTEEQKPEEPAEPIVQESPQPAPPEPSQQAEVATPPPASPVVEEVHNPIHNADEPGSRNNSDRHDGTLVAGKPRKGEPNPSDHLESASEVDESEVDESEVDESEDKASVTEAASVPTPDEVVAEVVPVDASETDTVINVEHESSKPVLQPAVKDVVKAEAKSNEVLPVAKKAESAEPVVEAKPPGKNETKKIPATSSAGATTKMEIPKEFLEKLGNIDLMDESGLSSTRIEEPFSEIEARRIRLMNVYLAKMQKQVGQYWRKPAKEMPLAKGVIKFELDSQGYLINAYIYRGSGNIDLDVSALDAVRSVARYAVPESRAVAARYYRHLSFHYSSRDSNVEEAPWEAPKKQ
jgi:outer membrane biosynthesis protein TonB